MSAPLRIAMWSGPRNLSTAMMRSFGSRSDTDCVDEPFYAPFLVLSELNHPMRDEILAVHDNDPARVADALGNGPTDKAIVYQKHMTHHMIDGIPRDWMRQVTNVFLVRNPARVLASYAKKMETVSLDAIGFPQQSELFDQARDIAGKPPIVVDADQVLASPEATLGKLCRKLGIPFDEAMLSWTSGPKPEDGAWAPHWYDAVNASTGFAAPSALPDVPQDNQTIHADALAIYERLRDEGDTI